MVPEEAILVVDDHDGFRKLARRDPQAPGQPVAGAYLSEIERILKSLVNLTA